MSAVDAGPAIAESGRLREAAEAFETLFLQNLVQTMMKAQLEQGLFGGGAGSSIYEGLFSQFLASQLSAESPLGIANMLERQWSEDPDGGAEAARALGQVTRIRAARNYGEVLSTGSSAGISDASGFDAGPSPKASPVATIDRIDPIEDVDGPVALDRISRRFGMGRHPIDGQTRFHGGLDLPAPIGTPVQAVAPGRVVRVDDHTGYGLQVLVDHGRMTTRYAHLSSIDVREGDAVRLGQRLGRVGNTGRSTGPHLHFETVMDGIKKDPLAVLGAPLAPQVFGAIADKP